MSNVVKDILCDVNSIEQIWLPIHHFAQVFSRPTVFLFLIFNSARLRPRL
jgi:hypothetical protein